uniref:Sulfotransferase 1C2like [Musca domestica] n=1 Tax=Lepeophtheirus salmonis TaxID=72036 RepID=A0A0K2TC45_LEPSM
MKGDAKPAIRILSFILKSMIKLCHKCFHNFETRDDDNWIVSFPKCGSAWLRELVWCFKNNMDFEKASTIHQGERIPFIEKGNFGLRFKNAGWTEIYIKKKIT